MDIRYKNNKIRKVCTEARLARRKYGLSMADLLEVRLKQLIVAIFTQYDNTVDIVEIQEIVDYH